MGSRQHLEGVARSARSLQDTVGELHAALTEGDEEGADYARDSLVRQARAALGDTGERGFEPAPAPDLDADDLLALAVRDLALSEALLSAGKALGEEGGPPEPGLLGPAARSLDTAAGALEAQTRAAVRLGFEPADSPSADLPSAVEALKREAGACLDRIADRSAGVASSALTGIPIVGTLLEHAKKLTDDLGLDAVKGVLAKLGARALERALRTLRRLIPAPIVDRVWQAAADLADGMEQDKSAGPLLMGGLLGIEGIKTDLAGLLGGPGLDQSRLDAARADLAELGDRFGKRMDMVAAAVALSGAVLAALASPLVAGGVAALLLGVAVVLAADYADAWRLPVSVRGVRVVVEEATA